jgi:hypothetical protein
MNTQEAQVYLNHAAEEYAKCKQSFLYFLSFVYISDALKGNVKFELWPAIERVAKALGLHKLLVILKARQIGMSWLIAAFALWTAMFHANANVLLLSMGEREAIALLKKCKYIYLHLPDYLRIPTTFDSATQLGFQGVNSLITALPSTEDAGRSESATLVVCDEWDFHEYAEQNYAAAKPTIDAGGRFVGISTRNIDRQDTFMLEKFRQAMQGRNNFQWVFEGFYSRPDRTEAQYADLAKEYSQARLRAEYPRTLDEALVPLEETLVFRDHIAKLKSDVLNPKLTKGNLSVYYAPVSDWKYVAWADIAEGQGEDHDFSVLTILGRKGLHSTVVSVLRTNTLRPDLFARECYELLETYYNPLMGYENNGLGIAYGQKMMELKYPRLYYKDENAKKNGKPGLNISRESKKALIEELGGALETLSVPDRTMVEEMCAFQYVESGDRVGMEAPKGMHDDTVMSLAGANHLLGIAPIRGPMPKLRFKENKAFV